MSETIAIHATQSPIHRAPCQSCPYRRDVPSGVWESEEYDKIQPYDQETPFQPQAVFMCHQADGALCRGWLDCHGSDLLSIRLACMKGMVDPVQAGQAVDEEPAVPVFETAAEAAEHGRQAIRRPGSKAKALVKKLLTKKARQ